MDFSGVVHAVGSGVECNFSEGDEVFGTADTKCGAFAEYVSVPATNLVRKPEKVTWEEAAALPTAGMTALQSLRTGRPVETGGRVLINGASSGVGTFAVQLAKSMGANVTGVCSTANVAMVRSLGADAVVVEDTKGEERRLVEAAPVGVVLEGFVPPWVEILLDDLQLGRAWAGKEGEARTEGT